MNSERGRIRGELAIAGAEPRATHLYSVGSDADPDHDAVIRIGGEAPGRRAHSKPRRAGHVQYRVAATSDRHLQEIMSVRADCRTYSQACPQAAARRTRPCGYLASGRQSPKRDQELSSQRYDHCLARSAAERLQFVPDTTRPIRCSSGVPGSPRRAGASRGAPFTAPSTRSSSTAPVSRDSSRGSSAGSISPPGSATGAPSPATTSPHSTGSIRRAAWPTVLILQRSSPGASAAAGTRRVT